MAGLGRDREERIDIGEDIDSQKRENRVSTTGIQQERKDHGHIGLMAICVIAIVTNI